MAHVGNPNPPLSFRPARRLIQLYIGLALYGISMGFMLRAHLGTPPWDVSHQGVAKLTGIPFGWIVDIVGVLLLLLWIPLRQRPGLGTISNALVIGPVADRTLAVLGAPHAMGWRIGFLVFGVALNGLAGGLYIGAALGPGPRDGLMTGLVRRTGRSIRLVRTSLEVVVVAVGWALGGVFGFGTVLYALAIGPLVQLFLPRLTITQPVARPVSAASPPAAPASPLRGSMPEPEGAG
jgi:uncharacterized membrane protein YczE